MRLAIVASLQLSSSEHLLFISLGNGVLSTAALVFILLVATRRSKSRAVGVRLDCPTCGYDLRAQRECRCPECGAAFTVGELVHRHTIPPPPGLVPR